MNEIKIDEDELRGILKGISVKFRHQSNGCASCYHPQNNARSHCKWCNNTLQSNRKLNKTEIDLVLALISNDSVRRIKSAAEKYSTLEEIAKPYIEMGLAESFAFALAEKPALKKDIMALWFSKWWQQYDATDILICSVLDGTITEDEGKWLNSVRSDHDDLAIACINGKCTIEWAEALLNSGFNGQAKAVTACLAGGMPDVIAQIGGFDVDESIIPPPIKEVILKKKTKKAPGANIGLATLNTSSDWKNVASTIEVEYRSRMNIDEKIKKVKRANSVFYEHFVVEKKSVPTNKTEQMRLLKRAGLKAFVSWTDKKRHAQIMMICGSFSINASVD